MTTDYREEYVELLELLVEVNGQVAHYSRKPNKKNKALLEGALTALHTYLGSRHDNT